MKHVDDPLSSNADANNNGDLKCCNCEMELTPENEVTHIPSYLSSTPGELIKIRDAVSIVFEGDIRAKGFSFEENEKVAMCAECTPSFIDMYNAYTKFMGLTRGSSWLKATIKESVVWTDKNDMDVDADDAESEDEPEKNQSIAVNADGKVPVRFEKVKMELAEKSKASKKSTKETDESDDSETVILPDLSSSPTSTPSTSRKQLPQNSSEKIPNYTEKFAFIPLAKLTEQELKTAKNFIAFSQIKTEAVKLEVDVGIKDLIKNENQEEGQDNDLAPKIIALQSTTTSTSDSSKFFSGHRCPVCTRIFSEDKAVIQHYENVHKTPAQQFTCQLCNEKFSFEWFYKNHIENFHDGIQLTFSCQICSKYFTNAQELDQHKQISHIDEILSI